MINDWTTSLLFVLQLPSWYESFTYFARYLAHLNSAINPIIYAGFNDNFQKGQSGHSYLPLAAMTLPLFLSQRSSFYSPYI
jgi:hypothetical protein